MTLRARRDSARSGEPPLHRQRAAGRRHRADPWISPCDRAGRLHGHHGGAAAARRARRADRRARRRDQHRPRRADAGRRVHRAWWRRCSPARAALGIAAALAAGALLGAGFAFFVVQRNANQVVAGTALNLLARRAHRRRLPRRLRRHRRRPDDPGTRPLADPAARAACPSSARRSSTRRCSRTPASRSCRCIALSSLAHTVPGLKLRMVGENPHAAETQGVSVARTRTGALVAVRRARRGRRRLPGARLCAHVRRGHVGRPRLHRPGHRHRRPPLRVPASCWRRCSSASPRRCSSTSRRWASPSRFSSS